MINACHNPKIRKDAHHQRCNHLIPSPPPPRVAAEEKNQVSSPPFPTKQTQKGFRAHEQGNTMGKTTWWACLAV
jgi:hypothetical protein